MENMNNFYRIKNSFINISGIRYVSLMKDDDEIVIKYEDGTNYWISFKEDREDSTIDEEYLKLIDFIQNPKAPDPNHLEEELIQMDKNLKMLQKALFIRNSFIMQNRLDKKYQKFEKEMKEKNKNG